MLLGFKTELKINNWQRTQLLKHCGVARHAWNWGVYITKNILRHNKDNPTDKIKFPNAIDFPKLLKVMVKSKYHWYYEVSKCAPQYALRHLVEAWNLAFKKIQKPPKFKKKGGKDSFTVQGTLIVKDYKIKVPVIGWLKTYERLPIAQKSKSFTISRIADKWFVSWRIEIEPISESKLVPVVGVDLGIKALATLSSGEAFKGAKSYCKSEKELSRLQRLNRRKVKNSNNSKKAQTKIARLHRHIANVRKDTLHKLTTYLAKNHSKIVIEDLNVSGMMANRKLAKAIADMGFHEFRRQLEYKCRLYGSELVVVDQWFPSSKLCSNCGNKKEYLKLSERIYKCDCCGFELDRDLNAAINLKQTVSQTGLACGLARADSLG